MILIWFQHTAARRRLGPANELLRHPHLCFNTQPPEGGWQRFLRPGALHIVSTHSRPKAAGSLKPLKLSWLKCFNTQPPEGGWLVLLCMIFPFTRFQHTAARRRLDTLPSSWAYAARVSTHSRPKAAGSVLQGPCTFQRRFNTQPPEGGWARQPAQSGFDRVSTHSRPKAAGSTKQCSIVLCKFQHTAARRRLERLFSKTDSTVFVSTHSRPKAAGFSFSSVNKFVMFQHTAARRRLGSINFSKNLA